MRFYEVALRRDARKKVVATELLIYSVDGGDDPWADCEAISGATESQIGVSLAEQDGMNTQRLLWRACRQEPRSGKSLEGEEYPKLHKRAQHLGAQMFFGDKAMGVPISTAGPLGGVSCITCQRTCLSSIQVSSWINLNNTALRHKSITSREELRELTISYHLRRMQKFPRVDYEFI